jgi:hypothetical protein
MNKEKRKRLFENIVRLRRVEREAPRLEETSIVRLDLERELGDVTPAFAANVLGFSPSALTRWIERGDIPTVVNRDGRRVVPVATLAELCEAVDRERALGRSHALEAAISKVRGRAESMRTDVLVEGYASDEAPHDGPTLRGIAYHRALFHRLHLNRAVANDALALIDRWRAEGRIDERYAAAWEKLLRKPIADIRKEIEMDTQEARDLRQNSPFAGLLSEAERRKIVAEVG